MKTFLLIDDCEEVRDVLSERLKNHFHVNVVSACGVGEALSLLKGREFDFIICDYEMPDGNGGAVVKYLRNKQIDTPIVLFSGRFEIAIELENPLHSIILNKNYYELFDVIERFFQTAS